MGERRNFKRFTLRDIAYNTSERTGGIADDVKTSFQIVAYLFSSSRLSA